MNPENQCQSWVVWAASDHYWMWVVTTTGHGSLLPLVSFYEIWFLAKQHSIVC